MKKLFNQNGEWHWFTGGLLVSLLSMLTYWLFQALSYKNYPFGITAGYFNLNYSPLNTLRSQYVINNNNLNQRYDKNEQNK